MEIWQLQSEPAIDEVIVDDKMVYFFLVDGRSFSLPVGNYPTLQMADKNSLRDYDLIDNATAVIWTGCEQKICLDDFLPA
ncbi:MAG: hypothetical protein ACI9FJ_002861 [Alteromonadaceae bacterium]|jgi:hypothetical protein